MKTISLLLFIILTSHCISQDCPIGYKYMPSISTSSLTIIANKCVPDSIYNILWTNFQKSACGESSFALIDNKYKHTSISRWINDSIGCITFVTYEMKVKKKWIDISKCKYYYDNRKSIGCGSIPCCGHIHITTPKE